MKKKLWVAFTLGAMILVSWFMMSAPVANAKETLRYSCSAQVFEAFEMERLDAFTRATGIAVDLYVVSSASSLNRLMNDLADIASTVRPLYYRHKEYGYVQVPFCKDPLAVIAGGKCEVDNLTEKQLQDIFSGDITNWKEVGGADHPIVVIVPGKNTGAYQNFSRLVMKRREEIRYDLMAYKSTMVIETMKRFPLGAISFIAQGAVAKHPEIKTIRIDGLSPRDKDYPYYQIFSFVTKGEPKGPAKAFIDFALSEKGIAIMKGRGMLPIQ